MSDTAPRYWLLDWHGRIMDHDVMRDRLVLGDVAVDRYPGIWFTCDDPDARPIAITLRKTVSLPMPLPRFVGCDTGDDLVALEEQDAEAAGREGPYATSIHLGPLRLGSPRISDWERYAVLSEAMLRGVLILAQPHLSEIQDEQGAALPPLGLISETRCEIGDIRLPIMAMRPTLERVAALPSGAAITVTLPATPERRITVHRR